MVSPITQSLSFSMDPKDCTVHVHACGNSLPYIKRTEGAKDYNIQMKIHVLEYTISIVL